MALARVFTNIGSLIIRKLTDTGGPPSDRVSQELDSIIAWAKLSPRCIHRDTSTVPNVGAGLDVLHTFSLPANSLAVNGDWVRAGYGGAFAGNNNTKRIQVEFDSQAIFDSGARDIDIAYAWRIELDYIRLTATSIRASGFALMGLVLSGTDGALDTGNSRWRHQAINGAFNVANLNSNAVTLRVLAEGTANNDIVQDASIIELCQQ